MLDKTVFTATQPVKSLTVLILAVLKSGALLSNNLEEALYKYT